jgi:hypothetical protein
MILRRRHLPDHLERPYAAFRSIVPPLEQAKAALTESVPGTRLPGRPLAETLLEFEEGLRTVRAGMDAWRAPEVKAEWERASRGLDEAGAMVERLRVQAPEPEGFEGLIGLIGDLLAPLEPFTEAAERFRALRR